MRARFVALCFAFFVSFFVSSIGCAVGDDDGVLAAEGIDSALGDAPYATLDASALDAGASFDSSTRPETRPRRHDASTALETTPRADATPGCSPVIDEVQTAGSTSADEFVEIANPCAEAIDVGGFALVYRSHGNVEPASASDLSIVYAFPTGNSLPSGAHFVVAGIDFAGEKDASESAGIGKGMLASTGGQLALRDGSGAVIDGVFYGPLPTSGTPAFLEGDPARAPASGSSIYRHPDGVDTNDNAADFDDAVKTPTPGAPSP